MGMSAVQFRVMPEGIDTNLKKLEQEISRRIKTLGGVPSGVEEQPIAFGLKALLFSFAFPEEKEIDEVGNAINDVEGVSSSEMTDYRRALG